MKVAIIRLSALGDVIVSASFVSCLKTIFEDIVIDWFIDERFACILEHSNRIDNLHIIPLKRYLKAFKFKTLFKEVSAFENQDYDYVIDMQGLLKSALIGKMLKGKVFFGFDFKSAKEALASLFYDKKISISYEDLIMKRNAKVLFDSLPMMMPFEAFFHLALQERKKIFGYLSHHKAIIEPLLWVDKKHILFVLEASLSSKTYATHHFIELAKLLKEQNVAILLLYYEDFSKAQEIYEALKNCLEIKILPKLDLNCIKALMDSVDLVIGGDTGITHLAWAMQTPSITLYGNTPLKRFSLQGNKHFSLSGNANAKYKKDDYSINKITPQEILPYIKEAL